jgi:ribosomal-protein-alanine N-acetyltransferase
MLHLVRDVRALGATALTLEVRVTNTGAQELYRRFGFAPAGIRKNYYADVNEDAIVMWAYDVETDEYAVRIAGIAAGLEAAPENRAKQSGDGGASIDRGGQSDAEGLERE